MEVCCAGRSSAMIRGYLFALTATAIWSGNFIVARGLSDSVPPVSLAFYRWLVAVLAFAPFAAGSLVKEWRLVRQHFLYFCITSFLGVTTFNTFIYIAGHTTSAMNLSLLAVTFPVFIVILGWMFLGECLSVTKFLGIALVVCGVVCLLTRGDVSVLSGISTSSGDLWMLAASMIFAVYSILLKQRPAGISLFAFQFFSFSVGLLFLFPAFLWEQAGVAVPLLTVDAVPAVLYVGLFASLIAFLLWNQAIVIIGPSKAGMVYYTLPLFSGALGAFFLHEPLGIVHGVSLVLILSGIAFANR